MTRIARQSALSRHALYQAMSELLTAATLPDLQQQQWQALIRFSGDALITAHLHDRLKARGLLSQLPEDIRDYLHEVHTLNAERAAGLVSTFDRLAKVLNQANVEPIAMKGIAMMVDGTSASCAARNRITFDVDVLVKAEQLLPSLKELESAGYRQLADPVNSSLSETSAVSDDRHDPFCQIDLADHRNNPEFARAHVPPVVDDQKVCVIDLHTLVSNRDAPRVAALTQLMFDESSTVYSAEGASYAVPTPAAQMVLAAYHSQIKNHHQYLGIVNWRLMVDLYTVLEAHPEVDLVADTLRMAERMNMDEEMYTVWELAHCYMKAPIALDNYRTPGRVHAYLWFDRKCRWRWLQMGCLMLHRIKKSYNLLTPRELRQSLGNRTDMAGIVAHLSYRIRRGFKSL